MAAQLRGIFVLLSCDLPSFLVRERPQAPQHHWQVNGGGKHQCDVFHIVTAHRLRGSLAAHNLMHPPTFLFLHIALCREIVTIPAYGEVTADGHACIVRADHCTRC